MTPPLSKNKSGDAPDADNASDADTQADDLETPSLFEETEDDIGSISRLRDVPFRMLVPNLITLGAICSGLTGIRLAMEARFELAIVAVVFAAILDGLDGRVARFLKSATSFGEQLDSLADFVNFGVAPALILYMWTLSSAKSFGWIVALIFAICNCLRLARFNVTLDDPDRRDWQVDFFVGVPAPAGAILALLPVYLGLLDVENGFWMTAFSVIYLLGIAYLMVSSIPTWSGKQLGGRVSREHVLPLMVGLMLMVVLLFSFPWGVLTFACLLYLASIPFSYLGFNKRLAAEEQSASNDAGSD